MRIIVILKLLENYVDNYLMSVLCIMDLYMDNIVYIFIFLYEKQIFDSFNFG